MLLALEHVFFCLDYYKFYRVTTSFDHNHHQVIIKYFITIDYLIVTC